MTKTKLYPYQRAGVWKIHHGGGRVILADEMALGKTLEVMFYAKIFLPHGPYVVVTPATIRWNWMSEVATHLGMRAEVLEKRKPPKDMLRKWRRKKAFRNTWFVVSHEILGSPHTPGTWAHFLDSLDPKLVVCDEAHYLCNPRAARTQNFRKLQEFAPHCILATGTPVSNTPAEMWSLLNITRPEMFPSELRFLNRYCKRELTPWGPKFTGGVRLPELHKLLRKSGVLIRRRTEDVHKDLPPKRREIFHVRFNQKEMKEYQDAEKDIVAWLRRTSPKKASRARRAERMVKFAYLRQLVGRLKIPYAKDWIDNFNRGTDKKLLVFGCHKEVVRTLTDHYKGSVLVDGSVVGVHRHHAIEKFKTDPKCRWAFMNIKAGGVGWNAKGISRSLFAEVALTPTLHGQAEKRTHGLGRGEAKTPSVATYLIAEGTIDEKLVQSVQGKQLIADQIVDGKATEDGFNVGDMLEEYLLQKGRKR